MSPTYYYGPGDPKERLQYFLDNPPPAIAFDVETVSIKEPLPLGFAIAFSPTEAIYFQVYPEPPRELELLRPLFHNPAVCKIAHNIMFDLRVMPMIQHQEGLDRSNIFDSMVAARLLGRQEVSLGMLAPEVGLEAEDAGSLIKRHGGKTMIDVPPMEIADKCQIDAKVCFALHNKYIPDIQRLFPNYFQIEMQVIPILIDLSLRGMYIDQRARAEWEARLDIEIDFYKKQVLEQGIEKPGSPQQVGYMLGKRGSFLPLTRSKRQLSTKVGELEFLDDPLAAAVLGYRRKSKLQSTYIRPMGTEERFYTEYYMETSVGRLNSRNRNIQNLPLDARHILLPDNRVFTSMDYGREHMYILAEMSQDKDMLRVLRDPDPDKNDIHQHTADLMGITRKLAKTLNYAIIYGATAKTISEKAKIKDMRRCNSLLNGWFKAYPTAADWITSVQAIGLRSGWAEPTLFGRKIKLPDEPPDLQKNKAVNYPILGSDGEVIKRAIILCADRGLAPPIMAATVHDSITFDGDVVVPVEELEMIPGFQIPVEVKQTMTWE